MTQVMTGLLNSSTAWGREARRAWELAASLGVTFDEEAFLLLDVRDLQTLRFRLQTMRSRSTRTDGRVQPATTGKTAKDSAQRSILRLRQ